MAEGSAAINNHASRVWAIADLLRGDYKQSDTAVSSCLSSCSAGSTASSSPPRPVSSRAGALAGTVQNVDPILKATTGVEAYTTSPLTLRRTSRLLSGHPRHEHSRLTLTPERD